MIEAIGEYVHSLALFMVVSSLCQLLVPEGRFKGIISLGAGLLLMIIILQPVNALVGLSGDLPEISLDYKGAEQEEYSPEEAVAESFQGACEDMLRQVLNTDRVSVRVETGEEGMYIAGVYLEGVTQKEGDLAAELCGIDREAVIIGEVNEYNGGD